MWKHMISTFIMLERGSDYQLKLRPQKTVNTKTLTEASCSWEMNKNSASNLEHVTSIFIGCQENPQWNVPLCWAMVARIYWISADIHPAAKKNHKQADPYTVIHIFGGVSHCCRTSSRCRTLTHSWLWWEASVTRLFPDWKTRAHMWKMKPPRYDSYHAFGHNCYQDFMEMLKKMHNNDFEIIVWPYVLIDLTYILNFNC